MYCFLFRGHPSFMLAFKKVHYGSAHPGSGACCSSGAARPLTAAAGLLGRGSGILPRAETAGVIKCSSSGELHIYQKP